MNKIKEILSKFTQTGFFHIFGGSVLNKLVAFLSSVVIVRILTKEEYGVFTYAWNIYNIIILLNGLGVDKALLQLCSERSGDEAFARRVCRYSTRLGLLFNGVMAIAMLLIGMFFPLKIQAAAPLLQLLCLLPIVRLFFDLAVAYLRSQKRNQEFVVLNNLNTVSVFVFSAVGALLFRERGMVLGYYLAYILTVLYGFCKMHIRLMPKGDSLEAKDRKALLSMGIVSMFNVALSQLLYLLDVFVLGIVDPRETILASYRVATIIPSALSFITYSLITYVYPYFAERRFDLQWCLTRYKQILLGLGVVNLAVVAVLYCAAPLVLRIFFGETYLDVLPIFRLLVVNYFFAGTFRTLSGNLLVTQRKLKFNFYVAIFAGCVNIAADFLFISRWGAIGAAWATVLVVLITSVLNTSYLVYTLRNIKPQTPEP